MCSPKPPKPPKIQAPPPPPPAPTVMEQVTPETTGTLGQEKTKKRGLSSLRRDLTIPTASTGNGLNIPY